MKKVRVDELKPNMILAETILGRGGSILLSTGIKLNDNLIDKIKETGKKTIYIEDEKSEVKIDGVADLDGEKIHFDSKVDIDEHLNTELMQKVEAEFEQVANTVKDGILNLNLSEEEIIKNTGDVTEFIKENFNSNYAYIFRSIMTMRDVDEYLYRHSVNVAVLSFLLAKWLGYNDEKLNKILYAGLLHDIGKLKVDQKVLNKPGKLTEEEFEIVKKHALYTYKVLINFKSIDKEILFGATFHHEKLDGSGYPFGLTEEKIPEFAKIIAIADIFDAMTSNRVYHKKKSPFLVLEMFSTNSFGKLDTRIVYTFLQRFVEYYIGSEVILNNGKKAKIVRINFTELTKPLLLSEDGNFIDMSRQRDIKIEDFYIKELENFNKK
ncbi:MAG: hypothetical protein PWP46_1487 [Fusobacteriaceae bacterium]|jgi:putative nucleotidyltransferase with HDIG domain|nr:hypothetical protein [Fusobacteriaceae bacterium]